LNLKIGLPPALKAVSSGNLKTYLTVIPLILKDENWE
jgi:hypothetical protein